MPRSSPSQAANALQSDQIPEAVIYITQEPCAMWRGGLLRSGAAKVVFGAEDLKRGACGSVMDITSNERINRRLVVVKDVLAGECAGLLRKWTVGAQT